MTIEQYFRNLASAAFVPLFFWAVLAVSMHQDRSRYRNTIYLMLAMVSSLPFAAALFGPAEQTAAGVISAGILILLLAVPYMLIANGVTMIRKEGRRLADLLSLLMGILVGTGELSQFEFLSVHSAAISFIWSFWYCRKHLKGPDVAAFHRTVSDLFFTGVCIIHVLYALHGHSSDPEGLRLLHHPGLRTSRGRKGIEASGRKTG